MVLISARSYLAHQMEQYAAYGANMFCVMSFMIQVRPVFFTCFYLGMTEVSPNCFSPSTCLSMAH